MKKVKALVLFSGGLDSILAAVILKNQGIKVTAISFGSCFFDTKKAEDTAKKLKIDFRAVDFSKEHLKILKNPKHGYGGTMNPCIDCHALMLKIAGKIMKKEGYSFVATGEVLGERPMSQNLRSLKMVEKDSYLEGYLLRPLSAKLLEETVPEKKKLVDRNSFFSINGRSRAPQMELAKKLEIGSYPSPSGGCILTEKEFGKKVKDLLAEYPAFSENDALLLRFGRHFWKNKNKIIVARNEEEVAIIKKYAKKNDILVEMRNYPGPLTLIRNYGKGKITKEIIEMACGLTRQFSNKAREKRDVKFIIALDNKFSVHRPSKSQRDFGV